MSRVKQVNNLVIKFSKLYNHYKVISPYNICLEEFNTLTDAVNYCKNTLDFVVRKNVFKNSNFINDEEKMHDFNILTKEEFHDILVNGLQSNILINNA